MELDSEKGIARNIAVNKLENVSFRRELVYCGIWTIFYLIAAVVVSLKGRHCDTWPAAAFFGIVAVVLYGVDTFLKFKAWKGGKLAQGERTITVATSQTSGSAY